MSNWTQYVAYENEFVLIIFRSNIDTRCDKRNTFIILTCERSGKYRRPCKNASSKVMSIKKNEYPFRLRETCLKKATRWIVKVICGCHNHDLAKTLMGHSYVDRPSVEEKSLVNDMIRNMVKPKSILPSGS